MGHICCVECLYAQRLAMWLSIQDSNRQKWWVILSPHVSSFYLIHNNNNKAISDIICSQRKFWTSWNLCLENAFHKNKKQSKAEYRASDETVFTGFFTCSALTNSAICLFKSIMMAWRYCPLIKRPPPNPLSLLVLKLCVHHGLVLDRVSEWKQAARERHVHMLDISPQLLRCASACSHPQHSPWPANELADRRSL